MYFSSIMKLNPSNINRFLLLKLPSAWLCGVRLRAIDESQATVTVRHRWINQNPFGSMYFAVQAMAAELSTGALVMKAIRERGSVSMLVASSKADFHKRALGKITFSCDQGERISEAVNLTLSTGESVCIELRSTGTNAAGEIVSQMDFQWTLKARGKTG